MGSLDCLVPLVVMWLLVAIFETFSVRFSMISSLLVADLGGNLTMTGSPAIAGNIGPALSNSSWSVTGLGGNLTMIGFPATEQMEPTLSNSSC